MNIGYAVILAFHYFHLRGKKKEQHIQKYKTPFFSKVRVYIDIYVMELNQTLCVNKNRKYKYIISLQPSPKRSNKHVICMMYIHLPFPLYIIISHMYETLSSFHLNLRVHLKLCMDISIGNAVILTNVNILNVKS